MEANAVTRDLSTTVDFKAIAKAQPDITMLQPIQTTDNFLTFAKVPMPMCTDQLLCNMSIGKPCPFVTETFQRTVFNSLHNISHPGIQASQHFITSHFFWPGMNADIRKWTRSCLQCQCAKVHRHTVTPLAIFNTPDIRFNHVHIDLVGPLPTSHGCTYLLTCVDRFTRWPEAILISNSTADTVAQAFVNGWIARFGMPTTIPTDQGQQFESALWTQLMYLLGTN